MKAQNRLSIKQARVYSQNKTFFAKNMLPSSRKTLRFRTDVHDAIALGGAVVYGEGNE
ncbi:MAG: hypothetical protein HY869_05510 [Chloroflexi bacterium]|nr:hypothetical protein [Chloroflexota bacterium]